MKKLLFFMAILALLTACSPGTEPETNPEPVREVSGDYQFTVSGDNNSITITKYLGSEKHVEVPAEIDGKPVVAIGGKK